MTASSPDWTYRPVPPHAEHSIAGRARCRQRGIAAGARLCASVTWDGLQWTWGNASTEQRVLVISVDNHDDNAPFPQPTGGMLSTLNSLFTVLFRGNAATSDLNPVVKDDVLLTEFGHALVHAELEPLGVNQ